MWTDIALLYMCELMIEFLFLINLLLLQVHDYLRSKLCSLYENDCIFDKFECCWSGDDKHIMTGSYNNFFRMFDRQNKKDVTFESCKEIAKPRTILKPKRVSWSTSSACLTAFSSLYNGLTVQICQ